MNHLTGDFLDGRDRTLFIVTHLVARCAVLSDKHVCVDPSAFFPCYLGSSIEACELVLLCRQRLTIPNPSFGILGIGDIRKSPEPKQDECGFQKTRYGWSYALIPA